MSQFCAITTSSRPRKELLGRFEECVMLGMLACGRQATADDVRRAIEDKIGDHRITTIITTLDRLTDKGFLVTTKEDFPAKRKGGRKRVIYSVTDKGVGDVERSLSVMNDMARAAGLIAA